MTNKTLTQTEKYLARGWKVQPLSENKMPVGNCNKCSDYDNLQLHLTDCICKSEGKACHSFYSASDDIDTVTGWLTQYPNMNLAVATGSLSGILVLEYDPKNEGLESFNALIEEFGDLPETYTVMSPSGGIHFYFKMVPFATGAHLGTLRKGIDIKADGGYVAAPPTNGYRVVSNADVTDVPAWLHTWLFEKEQAKKARPKTDFKTYDPDNIPAEVSEKVEKVIRYRLDWIANSPDGKQNIRLYTAARLFYSLAFAGVIDEDTVEALLFEAGTEGGHPDWRVNKAILQGYRAATANPDSVDDIIADDYVGNKDMFARNDIGNADRVVFHRGEDLRYDPQRDKFYRWMDTKWDNARAGHITGIVESVHSDIRNNESELYSELFPPMPENSKAQPKTYREMFNEWAEKQCYSRKFSDTMSVLKGREALWCNNEDFDADAYLLNVANGVVDLRTGELKPHDRRMMCSQIAPVTYDKNAKCPEWTRFLSISQPNKAHRKYLQRLAGATLIGEQVEQIFVMHIGSGGNGKGVYLDVQQHVLGEYTTVGQRDTFARKNGSQRIPADLASYDKKRMVIVDELNENQKMDEALLKDVTGGGTIKAEAKSQNPWEYKPKFMLHFRTNHMPDLPSDPSIVRRYHLIKWPTTLTPEQWDTFGDDNHRTVDQYLVQEASGILNWLIEGLMDYLENGLQVPEDLKAEAQDQLEDNDLFLQFLESETIAHEGAELEGPKFYAAFKQWFMDNGFEGKVRSSAGIYKDIRSGKYTNKFPYTEKRNRIYISNRSMSIM